MCGTGTICILLDPKLDTLSDENGERVLDHFRSLKNHQANARGVSKDCRAW